jgi:tRNA threonylcarbamoyladenosine biosynthesis protein TsaE
MESFRTEDTFEIGYQMGLNANKGDVYCLCGDLGVGKTVFTQGFAKGLGIEEPVNSPTFTIVQEYEGSKMPFYHFDVYRIADIEEMDEIGYEDYFEGGNHK